MMTMTMAMMMMMLVMMMIMWASQLSGWKATGKLCLEKEAAQCTCRSFNNALNLITATIVVIIVAMIKHADHDHHFFGHLAWVDQERQVVQGSPTQKFELAIRTWDVKNNT